MLIGARTGAWSGAKSWTNPYITDGLIAMWDGEWNAGGGVHDANAAKWVDLSGNGNDATVVDGMFTDDAFVLSGKNTTGATTNADVSGLCYFDALIDLSFDSTWDSRFYFRCIRGYVCTGNNSVFTLGVGSPGGRNAVRGFVQTLSQGLHSISAPITFSATWEEGLANYDNFTYVDCTRRDVKSGWGNVSGENQFSILKVVGTLQNDLSIKRLNIYSGESNFDVIKHNYDVDKARFGLT